jgi:hypothetical protein
MKQISARTEDYEQERLQKLLLTGLAQPFTSSSQKGEKKLMDRWKHQKGREYARINNVPNPPCTQSKVLLNPQERTGFLERVHINRRTI